MDSLFRALPISRISDHLRNYLFFYVFLQIALKRPLHNIATWLFDLSAFTIEAFVDTQYALKAYSIALMPVIISPLLKKTRRGLSYALFGVGIIAQVLQTTYFIYMKHHLLYHYTVLAAYVLFSAFSVFIFVFTGPEGGLSIIPERHDYRSKITWTAFFVLFLPYFFLDTLIVRLLGSPPEPFVVADFDRALISYRNTFLAVYIPSIMAVTLLNLFLYRRVLRPISAKQDRP